VGVVTGVVVGAVVVVGMGVVTGVGGSTHLDWSNSKSAQSMLRISPLL
jgi:hypothetical protein